jgi:chemotaxis methyl-accepting protein methylase/mannose-6-phosphate isomerase-like protein (cupin superfamily)
MKTMGYVYRLPSSASFDEKGPVGYNLYNFPPLLRQRDLEVYYIDVQQGHDTFMVSRKITRTYYILSGSGYFTIANRRYYVGRGVLVEVPPKVEYSYSGQMKMIALSRPRWFNGNDRHTRWNPDVIAGHLPVPALGRRSLGRLARLRIFGKSPINAYLRVNRVLWNNLPASVFASPSMRSYGNFLHKLARMQGERGQALATFFLRNRPQLELIRRLAARRANGDPLRVAVLGCSTGAEAYSVAWTIRSALPDVRLILQAMDISKQAIEIGRSGSYPLAVSPMTNTNMFERVTDVETKELFDRHGDIMTVKSWLREGIEWSVGDAAAPEILDSLGQHDLVVANNFLCHMQPETAGRCLRNIARLVTPCGFLLVSGIDLDIRASVANDLGWRALGELIEEIHEGDPCMRSLWPFHYVGLEPLDKHRPDWRRRYATAFQVGPSQEHRRSLESDALEQESPDALVSAHSAAN